MSDALRQELKSVQRYAKTLRFRRPYNILRSVVGTVLIRLRVEDGAPASPIVRTSAGKGRGSMCFSQVFFGCLLIPLVKKTCQFHTSVSLPSRKLTYPPQKCHFEDDFPFPQVGYVNPLEGTHPSTSNYR